MHDKIQLQNSTLDLESKSDLNKPRYNHNIDKSRVNTVSKGALVLFPKCHLLAPPR